MDLDIKELFELTKKTHICVEKHPDADLYIFGYHNGSIDKPIVWNYLTKMCRGLIVDGIGTVIERPFEKFWTYRQYISEDTLLLSENRVLKIPDVPFEIYEKVDGSMGILYWLDDVPKIATQRSFISPKAKKATQILHKEYKHLFSKLDRQYTYIFEAIYPETSIIIDYGHKEDLVLIGVIDKKTGESIEVPEIGFPIAKNLTRQYGHFKNFEELSNLNMKNAEGFVIHYQNNLRIKIKFPWYKEISSLKDKIITNSRYLGMNQILLMQKMGVEISSLTNIDIWNCLKKGDVELNEIKVKLTTIHYISGVEFWINSHIEKLNNEFNLIKNSLDYDAVIIWDKIKPDIEERFNIDVSFESEKSLDVIMWNWKDRYLKVYG